MRTRPSCLFAAILVSSYSAYAEPIQITIEGTPIIQLSEPIPGSGSGNQPTQWQYRMYPDQSGPSAGLECEPQASHFVEEVERAGKQRWELVNFVNVAALADGDETCLFAIFKRPAE